MGAAAMPLRIVVDTREQRPYDFGAYADVEVIRAALDSSDYSLLGWEDKIGIERKGSLDELCTCLTVDRGRFERELQRLRFFDRAVVIIEDNLLNALSGKYRSNLKSNALMESICAFHIRYGVPFIFAGNRLAGERLTYSLLSKFAYEIEKRFARLQRSMETNMETLSKNVRRMSDAKV